MSATKIPTVIKSARIFTKGDASVGLPGFAAQVSPEGDCLIDLEPLDESERAQAIEDFRFSLAAAFAAVWDERPAVHFDFENPQD